MVNKETGVKLISATICLNSDGMCDDTNGFITGKDKVDSITYHEKEKMLIVWIENCNIAFPIYNCRWIEFTI